jgi:PAS domain S-box-containing protein
MRENDRAIRSVYSIAELLIEPEGDQVKIVGVLQDITDRKRSDEALKESEEKFRSIMENSGDAIFITDQEGRYVYTNKAVTEMIGFTSGEMLSKTIIDLSPPDKKDDYSDIFKNIVSEGKGFSEIELLKRDGNFISVDLNAVILPDGRIYASCRDITDRKRTEEALNQQRRMLRTLIDNLPDPIYVKDKECRKVIANKADVENIGLKNESEVLGKTDIELFPDKIGERGLKDDKKVITTGKPIFNLEEEFINEKGVKRWLQTTKIPLKDKDGNITGLVGIGYDITERKRAEEELNQSYAFSESLLKTIPFGMDIVDEEGNILFQSESFRSLFGEEVFRKKCWELYRDDKKQCSDCPLKHGITVGETEAYESHGVLGDRIFEINHTGMMYQGQKAMLEIFQDITERKANEVELIRSKEKAEESDKLKTAFLHNISHEIRTPMNAIVGFSALLGEPEIDNATRKSYIETIMQSSNHLLSIITDIVDISNIEANLIKTYKNEVSVNTILRSLCNQFIPKAVEKKINIICETGLSDSDALVLTDKTKLTQILSNLLSNALKFTDKGQIKIWYRLKENYLEFGVSDTGIGISPEHHEKIFDRFYQVQNAMERLYEGTGLGLAISKAYIEQLGGKIWLTSEPGKGTSFYFTIPYEKQVMATLLVNERKTPDNYVFPVKKVILVAEDVESNFKLIRYFLSGSNAEVLHAYNGKEAVEKCLSTGNIDLILMDIKMPVMDGYTAVKLIREKNTVIPIIAQTAYADDHEKAIECGCSGFISKPFDKKSLFKVLCEFI